MAQVRSELGGEIGSVRSEIRALDAKFDVGFATVEGQFKDMDARIKAESIRTLKWLVGVMVGMFAATWAGTLTILLRT